MAKRTPVWDAAIRREKAKKYSKRYTDKQRAAYWKKKYLKCMKFINSL